MLSNVLWKTLRDQRRALMWWGIGLVALAMITLLAYPSLRDTPEFDQLYEKMPEALVKAFVGEFSDFTSPEGFLNTQLFFFMVPLMFLVFAIAAGSDAIAGDEARGTLELLLSNPLPRWQVVAEKFSALVIATFALAFIFWVGLVVGIVMVGMDVSLGSVGAVVISGVLLGLAFGSLALAFGCATGNRGLSMGMTSALAVAAYLVNALAVAVEVLDPFRKLSPFYHYIGADPLTNGLNPVHVGALITLTVAFLAVALVTFERRDLAT